MPAPKGGSWSKQDWTGRQWWLPNITSRVVCTVRSRQTRLKTLPFRNFVGGLSKLTNLIYLLMEHWTCRFILTESSSVSSLLVSAYVVCERLSVMQRQARLPEILTKLARTPCSGIWYRTPLPLENSNLGRSWHFEFWLLQNNPLPPKNSDLFRSWHLEFLLLLNPLLRMLIRMLTRIPSRLN